MTNIKAVAVSEVDKLPQYSTQIEDGLYQVLPNSGLGEYVSVRDLRLLLDRSPSVSAPTIPEGYFDTFKDVLCAILSNPARYEHIKALVESGKLTQDEATAKNINKAMLITKAMLSANQGSDKDE